MTSTSAPAGSSPTDPLPEGPRATGTFMLTLCRLAAPVTIRPPQSPQLRSFSFFTSSARQLDGSEELYLHMGYFETLEAAQKWVRAIRERYPEAFASLAPTAPVQPPAPAVTCAQPAAAEPAIAPRGAHAPVQDPSLSDTQVLKILEKRGIPPGQQEEEAKGADEVALLRPEDTSTRQALKEAVVQGAPVSFAVQLEWSAQPLDLKRVPSLPVFKGYTLYATETRREGRSRHFLRLGFFPDPVSAKQIAFQVRSHFTSAAVVPVAEPEVMRARAACSETSAIPALMEQRGEAEPETSTASKPPRETPHRMPRRPETLEQTLRRLAAREKWTDPDSLSESGVRHLRIEVQEKRPDRSRAAK